MYNIVLSVAYFPHPHDAVSIQHELSQILDQFGIRERVNSITTDNANNMVLAIETYNLRNESELLHVRCAAHIINLIVQHGLSDPAINN